MNNWSFGKLRLWGADVLRRAKGAEAGKKMRHWERGEGRGEKGEGRGERGEGSLPLSVFYACRTGIGSRFPWGKKKPWSSLFQMNIPKRKAFCKHGQKMHKRSTGADYLNRPIFQYQSQNEKNKDYSCSVCETAVSESLLSLRLIAWRLGFRRSPSDRGLRSWWRLPCLSRAQMSSEAVTQLFPLISTCQQTTSSTG